MDEQAMELLKVFNLEDVAHVAASNLPYGRKEGLRSPSDGDRTEAFAARRARCGQDPNETGELNGRSVL